jgi:23S rRNA (uracil1939-C5)-methyltransferase
MENRLFKKNQIIEIYISDLAFGGVGIGKVPTDKGDFTVFVQNAIPGQRVQARIEKSQKKYAEAALLDVIEKSNLEIELPYQSIPGAPYATLPIALQHQYKKKNTLDLLERIGLETDVQQKFDQYIESPSHWHYRNKMEYSFSMIGYDFDQKKDVDGFSLGFKHRGTWWCVENMDKESGLFDAQLENALPQIRNWCEASGMPAWHPPKRTGFYRFFVVRKSYATNQLLINLVTHDPEGTSFDVQAFSKLLLSLFGDRLAGFIHTINRDIGDRVDPLNGGSTVIYGQEKIVETLLGLQFEISMTSFFQTNPACAEKLYDQAIQYAVEQPLLPHKKIMDLFCGTGTIAQLLAKKSGQKVIGVDIVESAIVDARKNAARNKVENVEFHAADVGDFLKQFPEYVGQIGTIVLDPPRGGIAPKTLKKVMALGADRLVYISCNPSTQARDLIALREEGYHLVKISLADQFPHTSHVETIALLEKK